MDPRATPDGTANAYSRDVIGNKADAAVSTVSLVASIMAYIKGLIGLHTVPTADGTANATMRDVIGIKTDAAVTTVGTTKSLMGYIKALVAGSALAQGSIFTIVKTLTSSGITQAGIDLTLASSGGALEILQIILQTNGTGLATGTNFTIVHNNSKGILTFFSTAVSGLGANKTVSLDDATVAKIKSVLESGSKLTVKSTAADCTGGGTVDVYVTFRRTVAGATVVAA